LRQIYIKNTVLVAPLNTALEAALDTDIYVNPNTSVILKVYSSIILQPFTALLQPIIYNFNVYIFLRYKKYTYISEPTNKIY